MIMETLASPKIVPERTNMWFASVKTYCAEHCGGVEVRNPERFVYGPESCIGTWIPIASCVPLLILFYSFLILSRDRHAITSRNFNACSSSLPGGLPKIIWDQIIKRTMSQDSRTEWSVRPGFSDALSDSLLEGEKSPRQDGICLRSILTKSAEGTDFA